MSGGKHSGDFYPCVTLCAFIAGIGTVYRGFSGSAFTDAPVGLDRAPSHIPAVAVNVPHGAGLPCGAVSADPAPGFSPPAPKTSLERHSGDRS
jgi:hypothetical protein